MPLLKVKSLQYACTFTRRAVRPTAGIRDDNKPSGPERGCFVAVVLPIHTVPWRAVQRPRHARELVSKQCLNRSARMLQACKPGDSTPRQHAGVHHLRRNGCTVAQTSQQQNQEKGREKNSESRDKARLGVCGFSVCWPLRWVHMQLSLLTNKCEVVSLNRRSGERHGRHLTPLGRQRSR